MSSTFIANGTISERQQQKLSQPFCSPNNNCNICQPLLNIEYAMRWDQQTKPLHAHFFYAFQIQAQGIRDVRFNKSLQLEWKLPQRTTLSWSTKATVMGVSLFRFIARNNFQSAGWNDTHVSVSMTGIEWYRGSVVAVR